MLRRKLTLLVFERCLLQLFQSPAKLVRTRCALRATAYAVEATDDVVNLLAAHQLADALQVAVASAYEEYLLDDIVVVHRYVYHL